MIKVSCFDFFSELYVIKLFFILIKVMLLFFELIFVGLRWYWLFELFWYKEINRIIEGGI